MKTIVKLVIGTVLIIVVIAVVLVAVLGSFIDDDDEQSGSSTTGDASSTAPTAKSFGADKAFRAYAIAETTGSIKKPGKLMVKVTAKPDREATARWTVVCTTSDGGGAMSGEYTGRTPFTREMEKPSGELQQCDVSATAYLTEAARMRISLLG